MASEEGKKVRILEYAFKQFTTLGIPQVTMDDIARGIGMGKGTLYKYFPSKEDLILGSIEYYAARVEKAIEEIFLKDSLTPAERLTLYLKTITEKLSILNPGALLYLERFMPEVYEKLEETRKRIIMKNMVRLFQDGKKSGLFDPQMDESLVSHMVIGAIKHILDNQILISINYTVDQLFNAITLTILKGCLTEEGRKLAFLSDTTNR